MTLSPVLGVHKTSGLALLISFALGLFAAWKTMGTSSRIKGLLDSVFTIPMVLPPTVCGFLLPHAVWPLDRGGPVAYRARYLDCLYVACGGDLCRGGVVPLVYRTALGAFEGPRHANARCGAHVGLVRASHLYQAYDAAWLALDCRRHGPRLARAMGEFGCTLFFAGNYAGITQTIPIAIYFEWMGGNTLVALFWVVAVIVQLLGHPIHQHVHGAFAKVSRAWSSRAERKQAKQLGG